MESFPVSVKKVERMGPEELRSSFAEQNKSSSGHSLDDTLNLDNESVGNLKENLSFNKENEEGFFIEEEERKELTKSDIEMLNEYIRQEREGKSKEKLDLSQKISEINTNLCNISLNIEKFFAKPIVLQRLESKKYCKKIEKNEF